MTPEPDQDDIARLAETLLGFVLPDECRAGVAANLAALADHARRVEGRA